jgi:hypothetical protein
MGRTYETWDRDRIVIGTASRSIETCVVMFEQSLRAAL